MTEQTSMNKNKSEEELKAIFTSPYISIDEQVDIALRFIKESGYVKLAKEEARLEGKIETLNSWVQSFRA